MSLDQIHLLPLEQQEAILNGPALPPPPGIIPSLENPPNKNYIALPVVTLGLVTLFVAFSYYGYRLIQGTGFFVHQWDVRVKDLPEFLYVVNMASSFYAVTMGCLKVAILLEWMRTFSPIGARGYFYWSCQALLWINALFYLSALIAGNLSCIPHQKIWNMTIPGKCINRKVLDTATATLNLTSHLFILSLPQTVIWKLKMTKARKIGISLVFAIGIFATISAACRLAATVNYLLSPDSTYLVTGMALWCIAEQTTAILVFCIPALPKMFRDAALLSKIRSSFRTWSGLSTRRSGKDEPSSWAADSGHQLPNYRKIVDENGVPLDNLESRAARAFSSAEQLRAPHGDVPKAAVYPEGIIRTTHFETKEEHCGEGAPADQQTTFSFPWAQQR
ncbi:hypothetical protein DL769_000936 [Monosporascus sp. CRB-8-3]|nr:hypothetical protein DL769_000936 [Monosporascus sp. CRB-8-3]